MGAPLGLEPSGSDRRPLRDVGTGAGQAECRCRKKRVAELIDEGRTHPLQERKRRVREAYHNPLHRMQVLYAVSAWCEHPRVL